LTDDNRDKFSYVAGQYNQTVKFYNVEVLCKERLEEFKKYSPGSLKNRFTIGMWFRFLIPDVLPKDITKAIYLDADIVVTMDIAEYWKVELGDKSLAVCPEQVWNKVNLPNKKIIIDELVKFDRYFNSGSLLINLEKFRQALPTIQSAMKVLVKNPEYTYFGDQDLLNYCFSEEALQLPQKFNAIVAYNRRTKVTDTGGQILHYAMAGVLHMNCNDIWNKLFFKYFMKTPFHTEQTFGNIYSGVMRVFNDQKNLMLRVTNFLSNKRRFFCVTENKADKVKKLFAADSDAIITVKPGDSQSMFETFLTMKANQDSGVYIFVADKYADMKKYLTGRGLQEWKNFIDGAILFSEQNGGYLNTAFLVNDM